MPPLPDDEIRSALAHVSNAIEHYESTAADAYRDAAFNGRITAHGNLCAKRILLQRIRADLQLIARSLHQAGPLAVEE